MTFAVIKLRNKKVYDLKEQTILVPRSGELPLKIMKGQFIIKFESESIEEALYSHQGKISKSGYLICGYDSLEDATMKGRSLCLEDQESTSFEIINSKLRVVATCKPIA
jgi:hypothetical protein